MLNFSVAANIAVHSLIHLAGLDRDVTVSASQIAEKIEVSPSHLSKVLQELARRGLVKSTRGARGGFSLAGDPRRVTLLEVIRAVDPPPAPGGCLPGQKICREAECKLKELRTRISRLVEGELSSTALTDFASRPTDPSDESRTAAG